MSGALSPRLVALGVVFVAACGGSAFQNDDKSSGGSAGRAANSGGAGGSSGARPGDGGRATTGGVVGAGGAIETGGVVGAGGAIETGGVVGVGGAVGAGGSGGKGGTAAHGGSSPGGGSSAKGGNNAQGGSGKGGGAGSGGASKGGTTATGGVSSKGGSGGVTATGGVTTTGGVTATGGVASGGGAGTGGSAGANGGGVCRLDSDCQLSTDCCSCFAAGPGEPTSLCKAACKQSACAADGIDETEVACVAGRCVLARSCTLTAVGCDAPEPTCPAGQVPSVLGSCYGPCIAVGECADVSSCKVCEEAGLTCVTIEALAAPRYHCVSTPPACEKNATCDCMGVCNRPYQCSSPDSKLLTCSCPTC